jgi:gas vesicle protein
MERGNGAKGAATWGTETNGFFIGLLIGSLAAGIFTILYAPKSGYETRSRLKAEYEATQNMIQSWANEARDRVNSFSHILRSTVTEEMQPGNTEERTPG